MSLHEKTYVQFSKFDFSNNIFNSNFHVYKMAWPYFKSTNYACESFLEYLITISLVQHYLKFRYRFFLSFRL